MRVSLFPWQVARMTGSPPPAYPIDGAAALGDGIANPYSAWTSARSPREPAASPTDAAARVFDGYADIQAAYDGPRLGRDDGLYAIGSCFAREIEHHLDAEGANVLSLSKETAGDALFKDETGRTVLGYFHRYTPQSMAQDIGRALGDLDGWDDDESLIFRSGDRVLDFDLGWTGKGDVDIEVVRRRRAAMRRLSRGLVAARCVIVTLGLIEAWRHRPTGFWCNKASPGVLRRQGGAFDFVVTPYEVVLESLEDIRRLLRDRGLAGAQMVVTVSPVPLQSTFTTRDIVIANAESKATLLAAAQTFVRRHDDVHYFPSYEMATFSHPDMAWMPDRAHVRPGMARRIVSRFMSLYYGDPDRSGLAPND